MIRPMTHNETETVVDIWLKTSIHSHDFIDEAFWRAHQADMLNVYIPSAESWVFEDDGRIVGFYSLANEVLAALFVLPAYHGQGIGSQLLDHAKEQRDRLELTVYVENRKSCAFYEKRGFSITGEQKDGATGHMEYVMEVDPGTAN